MLAHTYRYAWRTVNTCLLKYRSGKDRKLQKRIIIISKKRRVYQNFRLYTKITRTFDDKQWRP